MEVFKARTQEIIKLDFGDSKYDLRKPKVKDQRALAKMLKDSGDDSVEQVDVMLDWLSSLGVPKDVLEDMYQVDLSRLINDYILKDIDDKKK